MLLHYHRRLLFNLYRQTIFLSNQIKSSKNFQIRSLNFDEQVKRKILLKINTVINDSDTENIADLTSVTCLNNELILSERMVKFPYHYRCVLEQQLGICQDRSVSNSEWNELYNIIGETTKPLFASITMLVCVQLKHIQRGRSLFEFIRDHHPDLLTSTATTLAAYMNLLAIDFFTSIGKEHRRDYSPYEKDICDIYKEFFENKNQSIVASAAALGIIKGLCVTNLWHKAYGYFPFINDDNQFEAMTKYVD
jgi:hypothetical protein